MEIIGFFAVLLLGFIFIYYGVKEIYTIMCYGSTNIIDIVLAYVVCVIGGLCIYVAIRYTPFIINLST